MKDVSFTCRASVPMYVCIRHRMRWLLEKYTKFINIVLCVCGGEGYIFLGESRRNYIIYVIGNRSSNRNNYIIGNITYDRVR